jgi:hypothetical protein
VTGDGGFIAAGSLADAVNAVRADPAGVLAQPVALVDLDRPVVSREDVSTLRRSALVLIGVAREVPSATAVDLADLLDINLAPTVEGLPRPFISCEDPGTEASRLLDIGARNPRSTALLARVIRDGSVAERPAAVALEASAFSALLGGPEFTRWLNERRDRDRPSRPPVVEAGDPVLVSRHGDEFAVVLNRPARRNAFSRSMRDALVDALDLVAGEPGSRAAISGLGPVFSSGGDLDEFGTAPDPTTAWVMRMSRNPGLLIHELRDRVAVRMQGRCAGAGVEIPLFASFVSAAPDTTLRLPEVAMGLIPGAGGTASVTARAGRWRACWLALSGAEVAAAQSLEWGLVDVVE